MIPLDICLWVNRLSHLHKFLQVQQWVVLHAGVPGQDLL